ADDGIRDDLVTGVQTCALPIFTVLFGFTASALTGWLTSSVGERVAGGVIALFGVFMLLYAVRLRVPLLYREGRPFLARVKPGPRSEERRVGREWKTAGRAWVEA